MSEVALDLRACFNDSKRVILSVFANQKGGDSAPSGFEAPLEWIKTAVRDAYSLERSSPGKRGAGAVRRMEASCRFADHIERQSLPEDSAKYWQVLQLDAIDLWPLTHSQADGSAGYRRDFSQSNATGEIKIDWLANTTREAMLAYADFDAIPLHCLIIALGIALDDGAQTATRRIFFERVRIALKAKGVREGLLESALPAAPATTRRAAWVGVAHMVACLERQFATPGYVDAAIKFEKLSDVRSALACVYRNVRFRLRDNQIKELDVDVGEFNVDEAKVDTMLAVLTATAPSSRYLRNRLSLYKRISLALKKQGKLERGLLDGLK
jgi:hypothetical protein